MGRSPGGFLGRNIGDRKRVGKIFLSPSFQSKASRHPQRDRCPTSITPSDYLCKMVGAARIPRQPQAKNASAGTGTEKLCLRAYRGPFSLRRVTSRGI